MKFLGFSGAVFNSAWYEIRDDWCIYAKGSDRRVDVFIARI